MWWAAILGGLVTVAGSIVGRVLLALGIGYVSYTGLSTGLEFLHAQVVTGLTGLSARSVQVLGLLKVDVCISILFSALTARMVLNGLTSGALKKMVIK